MRLNSLLRFVVRTYPFARGKGRLSRWAFKNFRGFIISRDEFGHTMLLNLDSFVDAHIYLHGSWEKEQLHLLAKWVKVQGDAHFIDVGANIGVYSLFFAAHSAIKSVNAFEPDPRNCAQLQANLLLNGQIEHVKTHALALSSEEGHADFYCTTRQESGRNGNKTNTGTSSLLFRPARHDAGATIPIATRRADNVFGWSGENVLIKIDVEGHECDVLLGMEQLLTRNNCLVQVEIWREARGVQEQVNKYFENLGYADQTPARLQSTTDHFYSKHPLDFRSNN